MGYSVVATPSFDARLDEAIRYRIENVGARSARALLDTYGNVCKDLSAMPRMGRPANSPNTEDARDLRWVLVDSYVAVYRVDEPAQAVILVDLFFGGSDWQEWLD